MHVISKGKENTIRLAYARVSTEQQSLDRQIKKFKEIGINERDIFKDKFTGKEINRPAFNELLQNAELLKRRGFDIELYFDDISRFSRTSEEGQKLYYSLIEKGYKLVFIATPHINSEAMKERFNSIQNIDMKNLGEVGEAIKNLVIAVIKFQVATEFDRVQKDREEKVRMIKEGLKREDVKEKLGKRIIYPQNLEEVMKRYKNKEITKVEVAKELVFITNKGVRKGIARSRLYENWDKYVEYLKKRGVKIYEENKD